MSKLFAVLLGGRAPGCNTELHDTVFVVGNSLEETYPKLVKKWFGSQKRLHIDASIELKYIDGHEISLSAEKPAEASKKFLYFVNFGGYKPGYFGEIHEVNFYVAATKTEALEKAKKDLCATLLEQHCDDNLMIDDITFINKVDNYYLHLKQTNQPPILHINPQYQPLDEPEIIAKANTLLEYAKTIA